jgi:dolichol-phosphate mannosyltransferase
VNTQGLDGLSQVAVVIPCYRCADSIAAVVAGIPSGIGSVFCIDDASNDDSAAILAAIASTDPRVSVITHEKNKGVGGATVTGYRAAIESGARAIVKIDSDLQMNPAFIPAMVAPILCGEADYVKGNRFFDIDMVRQMPTRRLIGNAGLTFISRISSGYWNLSDPTNGYTAISADVASLLPLHKLHERYFFESDMLFRLNSFGAVVSEQPIETVYGQERSHLSLVRALVTFPFLYLRNFYKRLFYNYFLRNFDIASLYLLAGTGLGLFGVIFGAKVWQRSIETGIAATTGTVMLSALPLLLGFQMLLAFLQYDIAGTPRTPIHPRIHKRKTLVSKSMPGEGKT